MGKQPEAAGIQAMASGSLQDPIERVPAPISRNRQAVFVDPHHRDGRGRVSSGRLFAHQVLLKLADSRRPGSALPASKGSQRNSPPWDQTRAWMPAMPLPRRLTASASVRPTPSSLADQSMRSGAPGLASPQQLSASVAALACAWRATLVKAS